MANKDRQKEIKRLRDEGHTYDYISKTLNCSKSVISYTLSPESRVNTQNRSRNRRNRIGESKYKLEKKVDSFQSKTKERTKNLLPGRLYMKVFNFQEGVPMSERFSVEDFLNKFSENPVCYLTGDMIDLEDTKSYSIDHKVPRSKGGDNSLDNAGLTTRNANLCKRDLSIEDFTDLCLKVVRHAGYNVVE